MSKLKRIAKSVHSSGCSYTPGSGSLDGFLIIHSCENNCEVYKNGGIHAVIAAMDKVELKKQNRKRHKLRKKRRGY